MDRLRGIASVLVVVIFTLGGVGAAAGQAGPSGEVVMAWHVTISPSWFDPSTAPPQITPFGMMYALHDALVRPLPGQKVGNSLAESWKESPDGRVYEFKLRRDLKFHNGDPLTTEDVKWSFERYKGAGAKLLQERVRQVEIVDSLTVRFHLKEPWPDFMTFYGTTASAAGLVVPKRYMQQVGDEGFKKHPIGAGPYKFVSHKPGVEVVLEANTGYWRKTPNVKRLVMKSVPETTTRVAMLKNGEADIAVGLDGEDAMNVKRDPRLRLLPSKHASMYWIEFPDQWDPKSPWHDKRVRLAANLAIDRQAVNQAETLGLSKVTATIIPQNFEFAWPAPLHSFDPKRARQLLAEAGYPNGFDAGTITLDVANTSFGEAVGNYLGAVGIRVKIRSMERGAFFKEYADKRLRQVIQSTSAAFGNAATRLDAFVASDGLFAYGTYPDIEELMRKQVWEMDRGKREALLHRIQQLIHDKVMYAPLLEIANVGGHGPRVAESAIGMITHMSSSAPYEELRLKPK